MYQSDIDDEEILLELAVLQQELPDLLERLPNVIAAIRDGKIWGASYAQDFYGFLFASKNPERASQLATRVAIRLGFTEDQATHIEHVLIDVVPGQMPDHNNKALIQLQRVLDIHIQQHPIPEQP